MININKKTIKSKSKNKPDIRQYTATWTLEVSLDGVNQNSKKEMEKVDKASETLLQNKIFRDLNIIKDLINGNYDILLWTTKSKYCAQIPNLIQFMKKQLNYD